jgi:type IV pilus assembly protein PilF
VIVLLLLAPLALLSGCTSAPTAAERQAEWSGSRVNQSARLHTELGASYFSRGQYAIALQELRIALAADAGYAPAYSILGLVHAELREDTQAEAQFKRSIQLDPQYSEARNNFGVFLCQRGRVTEAMTQFEGALSNALYATPERALANAGNCAVAIPDLAQADLYFQRALKRAPNHAAALLGMAEVHFRQERWLAARSLLRQHRTQVGEAMLGAQALWLGVRVERILGDREAEAHYGALLRRNHVESMQAQWLMNGQYDQTGNLL